MYLKFYHFLMNIINKLLRKILKKNILCIIYITDDGKYIALLKASKITAKIIFEAFIPSSDLDFDDQSYLTNLQTKYSKYQIIIILDVSEIKIQKKKLPEITDNVVKKLLKNEYKDDIIDYYTYHNNDSQYISTYSVNINEAISQTIDACVNKLKSVYFLNSILPNIIYNKDSNNIFIICYKKQIKFVVYQNNIAIYSEFISIPLNKSLKYIQGLIEQNIKDITLVFQITKADPILIAPKELCDILKESANYGFHVINIEQQEDRAANFQQFLSINIASKNYIGNKASYQLLTSIKKLQLVNKIFFFFLITIIIYLGYVDSSKFFQTNHYTNLNESLKEKLYVEKQHYKENLKNTASLHHTNKELINLYLLERQLQNQLNIPLSLIQRMIDELSQNVRILKIYWNKKSQFDIFLHFISNKDVANKEDLLHAEMKKIFNIFHNYKIIIEQSNQQLINNIRVIIPVKISIIFDKTS